MRGPDRPDPSGKAGAAEPADSLRSDNARMVSENASSQHASDRNAKAERDDAEALECARRMSELANGFKGRATQNQPSRHHAADHIQQREEGRTGRPVEPDDPYFLALHENAGRDPSEAVRLAAMESYAGFRAEQERFDERIEEASTLDARGSLEQRKDIQAAEYLAASHHRVADLEEILQGTRETEASVAERDLASKHEEDSRRLQERYRQRTGRDAEADERWERSAAHSASTPASKAVEPTADWTSVGGVMDDATIAKLATLSERWDAACSEATAHSNGPERPQTTGRTL
jgi:hypothetical protein